MSEVRAFQLEQAGVYVLLEDVAAQLREVANDYEEAGNPSAALSLRLVADGWLAKPVQAGSEPPSLEMNPGQENEIELVPGGKQADRIELYPDSSESSRPRWHARIVDSEGHILRVTNGSWDQEYAIKDAQERWPGLEVHLLVSADQDTIWEETDPGGYRSAGSGRRRPSPNRIGIST